MQLDKMMVIIVAMNGEPFCLFAIDVISFFVCKASPFRRCFYSLTRMSVFNIMRRLLALQSVAVYKEKEMVL